MDPDPDPVCPGRLDLDPVCPERLDPDPVDIRPDPHSCRSPQLEVSGKVRTSWGSLLVSVNGVMKG